MKKFLLTLLTALITLSLSWAQSSNFSYGFEAAPGPDDWSADIVVASGTDGITAASGSFYGKLTADDYTRFGGYNSVFPCNGYVTSIKIYLDVAGGYANDTRFDYSVAANGTDGDHERDFIFSIGFYDDAVAPGAGNRFIASASNNSPGNPRDIARSPQVIATASGWYTLEHSFEDNAGVLQVVMKIYDPSNSEVASWTLSSPADLIPSVVGGNRYGWFPSLGFSSLAIDDVALTVTPEPVKLYTDNLLGTLISTHCSIQDAIDAAVSGNAITAEAGTYNERLVIDKSLTLRGADESTVILDGTGLGTGRGIAINNGVTNVTIETLTVQNFSGVNGNTSAGIYAIGGNDNLLVEHVTIQNNVGGSGFYANGPVNGITLDYVTSSGHTVGARGIVIWNGLKENITITNCEVFNNNCCGIELQDGTSSGVTIQNNNVHDNGDNGLGLTGMQGPGVNIVSGNMVTDNGRFGLEIKNPDGTGASSGAGSIVIDNNTVSLTAAIADMRDLAGIAVMRRGVLAGNVDVPTGVVVSNNTVSGYQQVSDSDGFGIVIGGTNHTVTGNNVSNNDVGIQQQAGHLPYPGDGDQNNVVDDYFGRDNSPTTCGNTISGSIFSGNGVDERGVSVGSGLVTNTDTGKMFCSIQAAIDDPLTMDGHTITVGVGTYSENITISRPLTITGAGKGTDPLANTILTASSACSGNGITIGADNVHISGIRVEGFNIAVQVNTTDGTQLTDVALVDYCSRGLSLSGFNENVEILTTDIIIVAAPLTNQVGIRLGTADGVDGLTFDGGSIKGNNQGIFVAQSSSSPAAFDNIIFRNAEISNNAIKGIYVEKLSNALFDNLIMDSNGTDPAYGNNAGIDINLKYGNYSNIVISNSTFTASGLTGTATDPENPSAIAIKARDDGGTYGPNPATLDNVTISNCIVNAPNNGIRFGEPGQLNASPTNVSITNSDLSTFGHKALINRTEGKVTLDCNWHGTTDLGVITTMMANYSPGQIVYNELLDLGADSSPNAGFQPTGTCVCPGTNQVTVGANTFCSIQAAIDDAATGAGDVVVVGPGTYYEDIVVHKSVTINGPNVGISPNTGVRVAEAIIHPLTSSPFGEIIKIQATDVTINGLTIDGDNPNTTSTYLGVNGADLDAAEAITVYVDNVNNLNVSNNIIENLTYFGVTVYGGSFSAPTTSGHVVNDNLFRNLGTYDAASGIDYWGGGVLIYNDQYTAITNNTMTGVRIGVQTGNFHDANTGTVASQLIDGNTISTRRLGIFYNLHTGASVSSYTVSNNTISAAVNPNETKWFGIGMTSLSNTSGFATDNAIDGSALTHNNVEGYNIWNVNANSPAMISGGTVTGVDIGVFVNNYEGYSSNAGDGAHATISGVTITPKASGIGVRVLDSPSSTTHANVQATVTNCFINGGADGVKLEETAASSVTGTINNNSITGQSGNTINATTIANPVDATCNWYGSAVFADIAASVSGSVDFVPYLNDGTDDDAGTAGFQPVAGSCVDGPVRVYSDAALTMLVSTHTTIQAAIDDGTTLDGYFIQVDAGTYNESVIVDKSLTILGPNANISPITGSRVAEAVLTNISTGRTFSIQSGNTDVTISGFKFDGGSPMHDGNDTGNPSTSDVTFSNNLVVNSNAIYAGTNTSWADLVISDNKFQDVNATATTSAMQLIHTNSITVIGNEFININYAAILIDGTPTVNISENSIDGTGAQAIQLAGAIGNTTIDKNAINNANGSLGADRGAIRLYGSGFTGTVLITQNAITGGHNGIAVKNGEDITGKDITISENSITSLTSGVAVYHGGTGTLQATCNWYGSADPVTIANGINGDVNFEPYLTTGGDSGSAAPGFSPTGFCVGCTGGGLVTNTNTGETFCSIQDAIANATANDVLEVAAGTYDENVVVDKSLTINGPNADVACGSRGAEAIIAPASGIPFTVSADDVTINGFEITAPDSPNGVSFSYTSNVSIKFNNIHDIGTSVTNANVHAIVYNVGSGAYTSASVTDNCFDNISSTSLSGSSASAIGILQSTSTGVLTGLNIERNTINDVEVNTGDWPTGKIAYGIQINVGGGGSYLSTAGEVVDMVIRNNEITNLSGFISTGIGLEGNTKDAMVENNTVSGLFGRKVGGTRAGGGFDLSALKFENNRWVGTVTVQNNNFQVNTFTHDATVGLGYAVSNYVPAGTAFSGGGGGTTGEATISCNWLGSNINAEILDNASFTGKIFNKDSGVTNFVPYSVNDTDDNPGLVGFQPTAMSCIGGPVQVYDGNTFIAVYTEIQTAIDDATTLSGHTVRIAAGTYVENVDAVTLGKDLTFAPGASPGCVTIMGNFTLNAGDALEIEIEGTTACTEHDQFIVTGTVDLGGANIVTPLGMYLAQAGDEIVVIDGLSAINGTFAEGNFVSDGINNYYINYMAGGDGFDVVLTKCCNGLLDLGIFNYAATSPVGNKLQVFVKPNIDVVNGAYSAGVFTIRTLTSNGVTFTKLGGALSPYDYNQVGTATDGGYTYYFFSYEVVNNVDWTAGNEYLLLTLSYDCIGDAEFELTNDAFTMANNGDYYQELGAAEAQGIFYQPTVTSPTSVSITAANNGSVCATADIDLSSMTLDGTAPYTYAWSGPDGYTSTDADPAPFASTLTSGGTYTVTVTDANGCTATATTEVIVLDNAGCVENVTLTTFYPTITEAIDATETLDGHVIRVPAANWPENVIVNKALTINGANVGIPCDDPGRVAESVILGTTAVTISSDGVTIDGFTMEAITGISSTGFVDVSLVNNKINAKQFGITTSVVTTSATDGYAMQDNCIDFSDQVFDTQGFAASPTLSATQAAGAWYTDRYSPAGFIAEMFGGNSRLKHSIADRDCQSCRPAGFTGAFYNTQGRKYDISGTTAMSIELYIPNSWATTDRRMAGFWGTALDAGSSISAYPIIEFTSDTGTPRFRVWDGAGFVDLGLPTGFAYDSWYTLEIALLSSDEFMCSVGDKSLAIPANGSVAIDNVILQGHNTDTPGVTYDIYWDNFSTFCAPVAMNAPTVGINLVGANGSDAVVLQDNSVSNGFYGYVMAGVTTADRTTVRGGEYTDIMQGVAVVNTLDGTNFVPSTIGVADLSMTSFSGDYPALPANNFHSGVYTFTGGADVAAIVDVAIDNVTVSNTGKPQQNSAGIHFADFSTGADPRLTATVTNSVISNNLNRGVQIRGGNASAIVSDSDILGNGSDPFGAGGNNGYGVYAGVGSRIELYNNNIVNPATQAGAFPVTAIFNGVAPASTIIANNNNIDDNSNGDVTHNTFDISFFDATCNWWGSSDVDVIDALVEGNVFFLPYLDDGTDDQPAMVGFQTSANCINPTAWYVNDNAQTDDVFTQSVGNDSNPGTKRRPFLTIGHAVTTVENNTSTGPDDNSIFVDAGSYDEQVIVPNTVGNLTLQGVGPCDAVAPALTTMVDFTGTVTGKPTIFDIAGDGTVIDGIHFKVDLSKLNSAIIASHSGLDNITVQNNCIDPYHSTPMSYFGSYGNRNAISINYGGSTNFRVAAGGVDNILVDNNSVSATLVGSILGDGDDIAFRSAVSVDEGAGTYTRNTFQTINHDILVRFNSNGDVIIGGSGGDANTFNGGGVQYSDPNAAGGAVTISHNAFDGSVSSSVLRLQNNYHNASATVSDNTFSNLRWGASLENFNNVTVADNTFSPLAGFNDFRHITVNTKSISGNSAAIMQVPIDGVFTGNTFNAGVAGNGTAMAFYNHDSDAAVLGSFTVGTSGSPNVFAPGFLYAVYLGDQLGSTLAAIGAFPEYNLGTGSDTEMACWDRDIDVQNNSFDIGSGPQLPPVMNNAERLALEVILYHLPDNACLGELIYFEAVLAEAKVFLQGPYDSVSGLMNDNLRAGGLVPLTEPFSSINGAHPGSFVEVNNFVTETITAPVLAVTGNNAIVDWVWLELRDMADPNMVVATRSALVQRDGDIVDLDGIASVEFPDTYVGQYYLLVRHRNHLGAMTANPVDFTTVMPIDFTVAAEPTFGATSTSARRLVMTGTYGLWAGNTLPFPAAGFNVKYNGSDNDRLAILNAIGNMTPLNIISDTYQLEDVNMDGQVKYNGSRNDRVIILQNVGPGSPLNVITQEPNN
jgi:hypothetical protein